MEVNVGNKIIIIGGAKAPIEVPKNQFGINITWMHGDDDGYVEDFIGYFNKDDSNEMKRFNEAIDFCDKMVNAFPHGKGGYESYHDKVDNIDD